MERIWGEGLFTPSEPNVNVNMNTQSSDDNNLVFLTQTFIIPEKIKFFKFSKSRMNVSNKHLIIIFDNNSAYLLDKRILSPRRPIMKGNEFNSNIYYMLIIYLTI